MESARTRARVNTTIIYIILIIMAFIMLVPFAWMILTALKTNQEAISVSPFYIFPHNGWHWETFGTVWKSYNFLVLYKNTLLMIFFRVVCAVLTATMAGYAFGRLKFPVNDLHHPAVSDGFRTWLAEHNGRTCIPWYRNCVRYIPAQDRISGTSYGP